MKVKGIGFIVVIAIVVVLVTASMPVNADTDVISAGGWKYWGMTLNQGDTWYFSVQAEDSVDVYVMDSDNYYIYNSGGTPVVYPEYSRYSMSQVSFTIDGIEGDIYIVVKNNNILFDQTIYYEQTVTRYTPPTPDPIDYTPPPSDYTPPPDYTPPSDDDGGDNSTPGFTFPIMFLALFASVGIFTVIRRRR